MVVMREAQLVAAAKGIPPRWVSTIPGTELWAMLQATQSAMQRCEFHTDCLMVQQGCQWSTHAATAANHKFARVWAPIFQYFDSTPRDAVVWIPSHIAESQIEV